MCCAAAVQLMLHHLLNLTTLHRRKKDTNFEKDKLRLPSVWPVGSDDTAVNRAVWFVCDQHSCLLFPIFHKKVLKVESTDWFENAWHHWLSPIMWARQNCIALDVQCKAVFAFSRISKHGRISRSQECGKQGFISNKHTKKKQPNEICVFVVNKPKLKITG